MIQGVLLDLSGVIYNGNRALPGAREAVARLREAGLPLRFVTNTTSKPKQYLLERVRNFGIELDQEELFTPAQAACDWLRTHRRSAHLLIHPDLEPDFTNLPDHPSQAVVLGDAGNYFTYEALNGAFRALIAGADFLALANNRTFKDSDGKLSLDAGAFVAALQYATRCKPIILGKPSAKFFRAALDSMACPPECGVMVGDDAEMDVAGALTAGLGHGLLVRTGKYQTGHENAVKPRPTAVVDDIAMAAEWIIDHTV